MKGNGAITRGDERGVLGEEGQGRECFPDESTVPENVSQAHGNDPVEREKSSGVWATALPCHLVHKHERLSLWPQSLLLCKGCVFTGGEM